MLKTFEYTIKIVVPDWFAQRVVRLVLLYRKIRFGYAFRRIPLTRGKFAIVDPDDYERLNAHKWHAVKSKNTFYAWRVVRIGKARKPVVIRMHRQVMETPDGLFVDHINHNGLDNRKVNLRPATCAENNRNRRKSSSKKFLSRFKGVGWNRDQRKWSARILFNRKQIFIGYFVDEIEAAKAYDEAAKKYFGEFANLNFNS